MTDVISAMGNGFTCAQCGRKVTDGRAPIRQGDSPPFFCSFNCGITYKNQQRIADEVLKKFEDMKANDPNYIEKMRQEVNERYIPVACPVCKTSKVKPGNICWECATKIIDGEW